MTKPAIDWTKPLRVVRTHEPVKVFEIEPCLERPIRVGWVPKGSTPCSRWLDRSGRGAGDEGPALAAMVENIPPEPRIVERWVVVRPSSARLARVLIEEPGE